MSQVEICALESNVAALNLYEKVGFKRTDFLSDNMVIDGKLQGSHVLKMQRRDYLFFDKQCPLEGILTKLIPLKINDLEALYAVASDPLIWEMHPQKSRYQKEVFEKFFNDAIDSKGAYLIIEKSSSAIIGNTRFYEYSPIKKNISIGFTFLARSHWGGKYNSEVKNLMLKHAFKTVDTVTFGVGTENFRSQKALQNIGAKFFRNYDITDPNGTVRRNLEYRLSKSDF